MTAPFIWFTQQVPVPYTSLRLDQFDADLGWIIEPAVDGSPAVRLSRPANPAQNLPAIAPFVVVGVAYTMPERAPPDGERAVRIQDLQRVPDVTAEMAQRASATAAHLAKPRKR